MSTQVQLRRGTTSEHSTFTGAVGEVTVDTTKNVTVIHDGTTVGGFPTAAESALTLKLDIGGNVSELVNDAGYLTSITSKNLSDLADVTAYLPTAGQFLQWDGLSWASGSVPDAPVTSVNGQTGNVVLDANDIGLGNVDNTSDLNKPISISTQNALDLKADLVNGKVPTSQIPAIALSDFRGIVASESAMTALSLSTIGDWCYRSDIGDPYLLIANPYSTASNWLRVQSTVNVISVNGQTGAVVLDASDVGAATATQGATADTALQPGDNISELANNVGYVTDAGVTSIIAGPNISIDQSTGNVTITSTGSGPWDEVTGGIGYDGGDVLIGGTLPSSPNIKLRADGGARFYDEIYVDYDVKIGHGSGGITTNLAFGSFSLNNNTTGEFNVAVGTSSLAQSLTGGYNTVVGNQAMAQNDSGSSNTAIGYYALRQSNTAANNVAIGRGSLTANTTGNNNTAIGRDSLAANVSGVANVAIGRRAGYYIEGSNNTILGNYQGTAADSTLSDTVIISAGTAEKLRIDSTGSLLFGGTLPSSPNVTIESTGEITALADATINSVTIGRGGGDLDSNTAIGRSALLANTEGTDNIAVGYNSLRKNTTGTSNTAVGRSSAFNNITGSHNTALGGYSLTSLTSGDGNTSIGRGTLNSHVTGNYNTALGRSALGNSTEGDFNIAVGRYALLNLTSGNNNTFIGSYTGETTLSNTVSISAGSTEKLRIDSTGSLLFGGTLPSAPNVTIESTGEITALADATINSVIVGRGSGDIASNSALGLNALSSNTTGVNNTAVGFNSLTANTQGGSNVALGSGALTNSITGSNNTALGTRSLGANTTGANNTAVGTDSLSDTAGGTDNTALGRSALFVNTTGSNNTALGRNALGNKLTGNYNTAVGRSALDGLTSGDNNTFIGSYAGEATLSDTVSISAGTTEKLRIDSTGSLLFGGTLPSAPNITLNADGSAVFEEEILVDSDVKLGHGNGGITTNLALGSSSLVANTTGAFNVAVGSNSLRSNTEGTSNTAVGASSLNKNTTGTGNAAIGNSSLIDNTEGNSNTALGNNALANSTTGDDNTALGRSALSNSLTGNYNTAVGRFSLNSLTSGDNNTFIGSYTGEATLSDTVSISAGQTEKLRIDSTGSLLFGGTLPSSPNVTIESTGEITALADATINDVTIGRGSGDQPTNTAVGVSSLLHNTTGTENTAVGRFSLYDNTDGDYNTAIGRSALFGNTTGTDNTAIGRTTLFSNTTGDNNTALGRDALYNSVGSDNTAVGRYALRDLTSGNNNTFIGSYAGEATLSDTISLSAGPNEKLRIDSTGSLLFGGTLPSAPNITLANNGTASFTGSTRVVADDPNSEDTAYFMAGQKNGVPKVGIIAQPISGWGKADLFFCANTDSDNTTQVSTADAKMAVTSVNGDVLIGGTLPSAPNITLAGDGAITAAVDATINGVTVGLGGGSNTSNITFGSSALESNTTGLYNVAIGRNALKASIDANNNTAVGHNTLAASTTGTSNVAIGRQSLTASTEGSNNVGVGYRSLFANTTGAANTAIGQNSLLNNLTGSDNTAIGRYAGRYIEGSNNTIIGSYQGTTADSTLNDTVIISAGDTEKLRIDSTGSLLFGGTLPGTPSITLNTDGSGSFAGKLTSVSTASGDTGTTLATKDYVDANSGGGGGIVGINPTISGMIF